MLSIDQLGLIQSSADADLITETVYRGQHEDSPDRPTWHHDQSVLAWHDYRAERRIGSNGRPYTRQESTGVKWYDARTKKVTQYELFDGEVVSIRSMPFGWAVQDQCSVLAFDFRGDYLGRWIDASPPGADTEQSIINCWIDAAGSVKSVLPRTGLHVVLMQGNRFTVRSLDEFQEEFANQLPDPVDPFGDR